MYKNAVVGFDAREMWLDVAQQWTEEKKDKFLIRKDVVKPLSVDSYVWYSVLSELLEPRLWLAISRQDKYSGSQWDDVFSESRKLSAPDNYRPRRVWRNLASLQDYLQKSWGNIWKPCYLIAVVEIIGDELNIGEEAEVSEPISPKVIDSQWQLLGYDVADYELCTGLFDGVISPSEAPQLRSEWQKYLNEYHLFTEPQKAFDYITVANQRYPSHMPYYVYALYGIQKR